MHSARLAELSQNANQFEQAANITQALETWRAALKLLPPDSAQAGVIREHIAKLAPAVSSSQPAAVPAWAKRMGSFGVVLVAVLGKAKFLLLGLGKLKTLLTMAASLALYWQWYGWKFAAGFILGIYVHEMGHVWALRRLGLRASAPMFIPGFGAFISLYDSPADVHQDAQIGLAGPIWGAGVALAFWGLYFVTGAAVFLALTRATALINLFNLIPVWSLDGSRGFRALDRPGRIGITLLVALLWFVTRQGMFFLVLLGALYRLFWKKDTATGPDTNALIHFAGLLILFGAILALIPVRQF